MKQSAVIEVALIAIALFVSPLYAVKSESVQYRLPNTTVPIHYDIQISTNINDNDFKFNGKTVIEIRAEEAVNQIVLHSKQAEILKVELLSDEEIIDVKNFTKNKENEFLTINLKSTLVWNRSYQLKIWYTSKLREDKLGFYRSSYTSENGETVWLAATQFAPTEARHAFPCYDEPKFKATFKVEITHPQNLKAISNTDSGGTEDNQDGTATTRFNKTQIMSTYLVGFVISDFDSSSYKGNHFSQEVYARKNALNKTKFSGEYGLKVLEYFVDLFEEKFPVDTMKHVSIPDFYFNGMENWGMVTYRERTFFYDKKINSVSHKLAAITLISHEMAHSWFGNLVTMHWWTYVWLKEGFSTLYSYYGANKVLPDTDMIEMFLIGKMHYVFTIDAEESTRPMTHYVEKQFEIMANYDKIAYDKGACFLRMVDHAIGHEAFLKAVKSYLHKHKFRTAKEDDLFEAFKTAAGSYFPVDIIRSLKTWTSQKGYPLLTVTRDYSGPALIITQERFFNDGRSDSHSLWHIPVNFITEHENINFTDTSPDIWLTNKEHKVTSDVIKPLKGKWSPSKWIILNKQQTGYYRVNYDTKNWELISKSLEDNHKIIHVYNRAQLISDAFALSDAGRLNYSIVLNLTRYIRKESDYAPWAAFETGINRLKKHFHGTSLYRGFTKYMQNIIETPLSNVRAARSKDRTMLQTLTQQIILTQACEYVPENCESENLSASDPDVRAFHYCALMRKASKPTYVKVRKILRKSKESSLRADILSSFGCSTDKSLLSLFLSSTIEQPSDLRLSADERLTLFKNIYQRGTLGFNLTLHFLGNDWKSVMYTFPDTSVESIITDMALYINTPKMKHAFEVMLANMNLPVSTLTTAKTRLTSNFRWNLLHKEEFDTILVNSQNRILVSLGILYFTTLLTIFKAV